MNVRALPSTLTQDLSLFAERVSELILHPLVQETPLRAPHHLAVIVRTYGDGAGLDRTLVAPVDIRADRRALYDLLRILRFFELQSEPTNAGNIVARLRREPVEDTLLRGAARFLDDFSLRSMPKSLTLRLADGSAIDPATAFDLYLNGEVFHGNREKRKRWKDLNSSRAEPILYSALLHAAIAKANAAAEFYRILRVHGHVQPVPGDPTYVS